MGAIITNMLFYTFSNIGTLSIKRAIKYDTRKLIYLNQIRIIFAKFAFIKSAIHA